MTYIAKFPIHVLEKSRTATKYKHYSEYHKAYGYLDLDSRNRMNMYFILSSPEKSLRIDVAKHYLYDTMLFNLSFRPIPRVKRVDNLLWTHPKIKALQLERLFQENVPEQIHDMFEECLEDMYNIVKVNDDEKVVKLAENQFNKLVNEQWKAEVVHKLWQAKKIKSQISSP